MSQQLGRISGPLLLKNLERKDYVDSSIANLAFEDDLLYLDVLATPSRGKIGINTDAPTQRLDVIGTTRTTNLIVDTRSDIDNIAFYSDIIKNNQPSNIISIVPNQLLDPTVRAIEYQTANLSFTDFTIENLVTDSDINITANGDGRIEFYTTRVNVNGTLHATGDITWDGNIIIGSDNNDNVVFDSDIASSLIPNTSNSYDLGSDQYPWKKLYTTTIDVDTATVNNIYVNDIDLLLRQGNTIYVSTTGNDSLSSHSTDFVGNYDNATAYQIGDCVLHNSVYYRRIADPGNVGYAPPDVSRWVITIITANDGTHPHSPFRTIKHALSVAQSGDEIIIFPGIYVEEFPLTIPQGVSVRGTSIRSVKIEPTTLTNDQDCFLMNGETTVSFLTVQNFYRNSINNTGYAFRLASNVLVTSRSPYVFNVTVITRGSVTSIADPLGFNEGDAGCGALIDGSSANSNSKEATILFFSATFIVPNSIGIWATNGARVEWLNSFTYYAEKGIYLTTGTLGFASEATKFGAEMRSINSANVYGTYGAVADGQDTLGYLIGHNFGYIGTGADSNNDYGLVIQANEVVAINDGIIYYDSMDHKGDYRVGNIFYVNQETGQVSFDAQSINLSAQGNITLEGPNGVTIIDATQVKTGNIRIHDNNIDSISGPVNIYAASSSTYLNTDVFVTGSLDITDNLKIDGTLYLGNDAFDNIFVVSQIDQTVKPKTDRTYDLGKKGLDPKVWNTAFLKKLDIDAVTEFENNTITTVTTDTDLKFIAAGSGLIRVTSTNVDITEDLTVIGNTTVNGLTTLKNLEIDGTVEQLGDFNQTGNSDITGTFQTVNLEVIDTLSYLDVPDIRIVTNQINATATNDDLIFTANGTGGVRFEYRLTITDNEIANEWASATTDLQQSIVFDPDGTGNVLIDSTKAIKLPYANNSNRILNQVGELRQNSTTTLYEGYLNSTANASLTNLYDTDRNTYITAELTPGANDNTLRFANNGTVYTTITDYALTNNVVHIDDIRITNNIISNLISTNDINVGIDATTINNINDILIQENTITNQADTALILESTGTGYFKFAGSNAIRIPTGTDAERRLSPEIAEIRINSDSNYEMEVFDGINWIPASGPLSAATEEEVTEIMDTWALILG